MTKLAHLVSAADDHSTPAPVAGPQALSDARLGLLIGSPDEQSTHFDIVTDIL